ncbi:unnamed protein product [Acanthoscelides obtectus]|nr:unnamed protein product [Acanthoscelides obtectus]CAK1639901.1 Solute carrier family 2, facilitated glucose transporter member 6 [Acanthoscelides obtectus]
MDPIGASCFSLHIEENNRAIIEERKQDRKFSEIIVSCRSLSHYEGRTFKTLLPQILAAFIAAGYHIVVGISLAYSAILIPALDRNVTNGTDDGEITATKTECSWIASVLVIIIPLGALSGGVIMDQVGRLNTLKLAAIPSVLGWSLIAAATNVPMIIFGRLIVGFASDTGPYRIYSNMDNRLIPIFQSPVNRCYRSTGHSAFSVHNEETGYEHTGPYGCNTNM